MQSKEQLAEFKALCLANNLGKTDVWQHKQSGNWIISRPGIEKIQGLNNITIALELASAALDFAIVKATATRTAKAEGAKAAKKLSVESLGSAQPKNCQVTYYAEMAEKRAKSRAILQLMGFYSLGVYGEDEADDFKRDKDSGAFDEAPAKVQPEAPAPVAPAPEAPKKAEAEAVPPVSAPQVVLATSAPSSADEPTLDQVINQIALALRSHHITERERSRMMAGVNKLSLAEAKTKLATIEETVEHRPSPQGLTAARNKLRAFVSEHHVALGRENYEYFTDRANALTVATVDLYEELERATDVVRKGAVAA